MAGKVDQQRPKDVVVDPNSDLVELGPGCDDVVIGTAVPAREEEEHGYSDAFSEDDNLIPGEEKHRKRRKSKAKRQDHVVSKAKAPKLRPAGGRTAAG